MLVETKDGVSLQLMTPQMQEASKNFLPPQRRRPRHFQTYFAVVVEVGIEAHAVSACGLQVDQRGRVGVVLGKVHVELKAAVGVRGVRRARDQDLVERTQGEASLYLEKKNPD